VTQRPAQGVPRSPGSQAPRLGKYSEAGRRGKDSAEPKSAESIASPHPNPSPGGRGALRSNSCPVSKLGNEGNEGNFSIDAVHCVHRILRARRRSGPPVPPPGPRFCDLSAASRASVRYWPSPDHPPQRPSPCGPLSRSGVSVPALPSRPTPLQAFFVDLSAPPGPSLAWCGPSAAARAAGSALPEGSPLRVKEIYKLRTRARALRFLEAAPLLGSRGGRASEMTK